MSSVVMASEDPVYSHSTPAFPLALLLSILFHGMLALAAHQLWPTLFEIELKIPVQPISVSLFTPAPQPPEPEPVVEPIPEPVVEPPPPPPKPVAKPKPVPKKPKPKPKPTPKPIPAKTPPPVEKAIKTPPAPQPVQQISRQITPQPTYRPEPKYPMIARRRGQQGVVILELTLSTSGAVSKALVVESSGHRSLDESALNAVKSWRFPANRFNGLSSFRQRIEFTLDR